MVAYSKLDQNHLADIAYGIRNERWGNSLKRASITKHYQYKNCKLKPKGISKQSVFSTNFSVAYYRIVQSSVTIKILNNLLKIKFTFFLLIKKRKVLI